MANVNYLFLTKNGSYYNTTSNAWQNVLTWYIKNYVGYGSVCKLDEVSWNSVSTSIENNMTGSGGPKNEARINFFNSICTNPGLCIKKVVYNHTLLYPSEETVTMPQEVKNFFIVSSEGKYFYYTVATLSAALNAYITENLQYNSSFNASEQLWNDLDSSITDDKLRINTFNTLCKRNKHKIVAVAVNVSNIYPLSS